LHNWGLCRLLGFRNQIGGEHRAHCQRDLLCRHDSHVRGPGVSSRLWKLWTLVALGPDRDLLGVPILYDGHQKTGPMAGCYGVVYHSLYCICKSYIGTRLSRFACFGIILSRTDIDLGCHSCFLCRTFSETGSIHATCEESKRRRPQGGKDRPSRI
jgi:hypothetical protein